MVRLELIAELLHVRLKRVLDAARLVMSAEQFAQYRKIVLDEFGRRGMLKDLEREIGSREWHG